MQKFFRGKLCWWYNNIFRERGFIPRVVGIKYAREFFSWFYSIWETEVEGSIQISGKFYIK